MINLFINDLSIISIVLLGNTCRDVQPTSTSTLSLSLATNSKDLYIIENCYYYYFLVTPTPYSSTLSPSLMSFNRSNVPFMYNIIYV